MGGNYKCPHCNAVMDRNWYWQCRECEKGITFCNLCKQYSPLVVRKSDSSPESYAVCSFCGHKNNKSIHVYKSSIYKYYKFAFKFVNRVHIPYPMYFDGQDFPVGSIKEDIGDYINDFSYVESTENDIFGTDWGTARAYKVDINEGQTAIALSHETGLEIFLIAAGGFVGIQAARFTLKQTLEKIENNINRWWGKNKKLHPLRYEKVEEGDLVIAVQVRTPNWELTLDGIFQREEKDRIFKHLEMIMAPQATAELNFEEINDNEIKKKISKKTKEIKSRLRTNV